MVYSHEYNRLVNVNSKFHCPSAHWEDGSPSRMCMCPFRQLWSTIPTGQVHMRTWKQRFDMRHWRGGILSKFLEHCGSGAMSSGTSTEAAACECPDQGTNDLYKFQQLQTFHGLCNFRAAQTVTRHLLVLQPMDPADNTGRKGLVLGRGRLPGWQAEATNKRECRKPWIIPKFIPGWDLSCIWDAPPPAIPVPTPPFPKPLETPVHLLASHQLHLLFLILPARNVLFSLFFAEKYPILGQIRDDFIEYFQNSTRVKRILASAVYGNYSYHVCNQSDKHIMFFHLEWFSPVT